MAKEGKKALVPKLRFPEFRDAEEWRPKLLGEVCGMQAGKFIAASEILDKQSEGLYPCFGGNGLRGYTRNYNQSGRYSLIGRQGALCGNVNLVEGDFYATEHAVVTTPKAGISTDWNFYNLCLLNLNRFATGQAQPGLSVDVLEKVSCAVPKDEEEQQKIADCLSSLDELIAAQARKVEALKTYKRGLMQQLFPGEGETLPRLRFPEFHDAPEWDTNPLEEYVVRSFYGTSSSTAERGQYPVLRMGNMVNGGLVFSNLVYLDLDRESFEDIRLVRGDILLNRTNSPDLVGKIAMFDREIDCITASYIVTYRLDMARLNPTYCNAMMNSPRYQAKIKLLSRPSVSQANINPTTFKKELIVAVPSPAEQQRIANCFTTLDARITAACNRLAALTFHKKGLMQQLFPSLEEA